MRIGEILSYLDRMNIKYSFSGDETFEIHSFCPLKDLKENSILGLESWMILLYRKLIIRKEFWYL